MKPAEIKGLFFSLVEAIGGQAPAASYLGLSQPRISQLCNPTCADMPTLIHIHTLECVIEQPIVSSALARAARGETPGSDPMKEINDVVIAGAEVLHLQRSGAPLHKRKAAALRLVKEAEEVADSYGRGAA